jgi:hypothetical protein
MRERPTALGPDTLAAVEAIGIRSLLRKVVAPRMIVVDGCTTCWPAEARHEQRARR